MAGGTSLVAESGAFGSKVVFALPLVAAGVAVVTGPVEVTPGAVTAGMETWGAVVSPELSLPHPVTISPMAIAASGMHPRRPVTSRRGPAGAVRSRGSR